MFTGRPITTHILLTNQILGGSTDPLDYNTPPVETHKLEDTVHRVELRGPKVLPEHSSSAPRKNIGLKSNFGELLECESLFEKNSELGPYSILVK